MVLNPSKHSQSEVDPVMKKLNIDPTHSNKPSAIEYRLKRAHSAASVALQFLEGVDPGISNIGIRLVEARSLAYRLEALCSEMRQEAPQKRIHGKKAREAAGIVEVEKPKRPRGRPRKVPTVSVESPTEAAVVSTEQLDETLKLLDVAAE